jgi:hypothetical protein
VAHVKQLHFGACDPQLAQNRICRGVKYFASPWAGQPARFHCEGSSICAASSRLALPDPVMIRPWSGYALHLAVVLTSPTFFGGGGGIVTH